MHAAFTFGKLEEESIRDVVLVALNSHYENMVTGETFRKRGKTDILIEFENQNAYIGECKIWHGEAKTKEKEPRLLVLVLQIYIFYYAFISSLAYRLYIDKFILIIELSPFTSHSHILGFNSFDDIIFVLCLFFRNSFIVFNTSVNFLFLQ